MTEPSLDLQKAIRARLVATSALTALVPATSIFDRNLRPETFPCIILGEGHTFPGEGLARNRVEVYLDLHLWTAGDSLASVKLIAQAIRSALADRFWTLDAHSVADLYVRSVRFIRDKDSERSHDMHSHGVMTLFARLVELGQ